MAASMDTEVTLIDGEKNKIYGIKIGLKDAERAQKDLQFAATLLERAKLNATVNSKETTMDIENSVSDNQLNVDITNKSTKEQHNWTKEETFHLMDIYTAKKKEFHNGKNTVKHCWENVSKEMEEKGYNISGQKCCIKFQAMKRTYKSIKDHKNRSGNDARKWEYFDLMDNIFNKRPWIKPLAVARTSMDESDSSTEEARKQPRTKRKLNIEQYMEKWLEEKVLKRKAAEERHNEKMEQLQKIQDLLQKIVEK